MPQTRNMTIHEKLEIGMKAIEMQKQGNIAEHDRLMKSIPLPHYMAKFVKDYIGTDFLVNGGWNLSEAEAQYGPDWLTQ